MSYLLYNNTFNEYQKNINELGNYNSFFYDNIRSGDICNFILVLPTNRVVRYLKRKITKEYFKIHKKPLRSLKIFNLESFAKNVFFELIKINSDIVNSDTTLNVNNEISFVSDALRFVLTEEAFANSKLDYYTFNKSKIKLEIIKKLSELIYGLREDGFSSKEALEQLAGEEDLRFNIIDTKKNSDILKLIIEYEKLLSPNLYDIPKMFSFLNEYLSAKKNKEIIENVLLNIFGNEAKIVLLGFSEFKQPESKFLSSFNNLNIPFCVFLEYSDTNGPLFGNFQEVIQSFIQCGFNLFSDEELFENYSQVEDNNNFYLKKYLFNYNSSKISKFLDDEINIFETLTIDDEVTYITKLVKYLKINENINFENIAIVSRKPEEYSQLFREKFHRENIPINVSDRFKLADSKLIGTITGVLELLTEFNLEKLRKVLSSRNLQFSENIDTENIINIIKILRIRPFFYKNNSSYIIEKAKSYLEFSKTQLLDEKIDYHERRKYQETQENLLKFIKQFQILLTKFSIINQDFSSYEIYSFINEVFSQFKIKDAYNNNIHKYLENEKPQDSYEYFLATEEIEKENAAVEEFIQLIKDMKITYRTRFSDKKFDLKTWNMRIKIAVENTRFQVKEKISYGVEITSIEQIRMIPFKVKILCGMNDGEFPTVYYGEQVIGRELKDAKKRHIRGERIIFYQFLSKIEIFNNFTDQKIYLFYHSLKNGEALSPSPFIENLLKITNLKEKNKIYDLNNQKNDKQLLSKIPWIRSISLTSEIFDYLLNNNYKKENNDDVTIKDLLEKYIENDELQYLLQINRASKNSDNKIETFTLSENRILEFKNKTYSISELENYAKCPYKYYIEKVLRIPQPEEVRDELSSMEIGTFFHSILFKFYQVLLEMNESIVELNITSENGFAPIKAVKLEYSNYEKYKQVFFNIIKENLLNPVYDHPFIHLETRNLLLENPQRNPLLYWLEKEMEKVSLGWDFLPFAFELQLFSTLNNFDIDGNIIDQMKFNIKTDKASLKVKGNTNYLGVIDYKLSEKSISNNNKIIKEYQSFQMPLYLAVISNNWIEKGVETEPYFGLYNVLKPNLKKGKDNYQFVLLGGDEQFPEAMIPKKKSKSQYLQGISTKEAINQSVKKVFEIRQMIIEGVFPITDNQEKNCRYCQFTSLCRRNSIN